MTRRFTETEKWKDEWFLSLPFEAKLLFVYLCDNCDCAGFWEVDYEQAQKRTGLPAAGATLLAGPELMSVEDAMAELQARLIWRDDGRVVYIKNFLRHQGNWPLKKIERVPYGRGIIQRFDAYGTFGKHVYRVLESQPSEELVSDLIYGADSNPLRKGAAKIRDLAKSLGNGSGNGKKGSAEGKRCVRAGCRSPGIHPRTDDTGHTYYLCEEHEQQRLAAVTREN